MPDQAQCSLLLVHPMLEYLSFVLHFIQGCWAALQSLYALLSERPAQKLSDDTVDFLLRCLEDARKVPQHLTSLHSLDDVLSQIISSLPAHENSKNPWSDIRRNLSAIHTLLQEYCRNLERSEHYTQLPDHNVQGLREFCLHLCDLVPVLQRFQKLRSAFLRRRSLSTDIETCRHSIEESVKVLNADISSNEFYEVSLEELALNGNILDISETATPCRYRLVDCRAFVERRVLCIHDFAHFPHVPYSAVSYVWRGNLSKLQTMSSQVHIFSDTFVVRGAEDGDPIGLDALHHVCVASMQNQCHYIWLDRLCIMQTSRDDKAWQISNMFDIYWSCQSCLVLPGGIGRLVTLEEETTWIHRAWTLQEVLAPKKASVVFSWRHGATEIGGPGGPCPFDVVVPHLSAMSPLKAFLRISFASKRWVTKGNRFLQVNPALFGPSARRQVLVLVGAMEEQNPDARAQAIWRSASMRTSSRPVDMVFSIMGIFGVTLPVKAFHKDDRIGATKSLAQEILRRGGKAHWLGASLRLPPCNQLSSFPVLPHTSVAIIPRIQMEDGVFDVAEAIEHSNYNWWLDGLPVGSMDDEGYLLCKVRSIALIPTRYRRDFISKSIWLSNDGLSQLLIKAVDLSIWEIISNAEEPCYCTMLNDTFDKPTADTILHSHDEHSKAADPQRGVTPRTFAVYVGRTQQYTSSIPALGLDLAHKSLRAVIVKEHSPGRFHRTTYIEIEDAFAPFVEAWPEHDVHIGGPASVATAEPDEASSGLLQSPVHVVTTSLVESKNIDYEPPIGTIDLSLEESSDGPVVSIGGRRRGV